MKQFEVLKIFCVALIIGNIMGVILIQIFRNLTIKNIVIMEIVLTMIIIMLFIVTKIWNDKQSRMKNNKQID